MHRSKLIRGLTLSALTAVAATGLATAAPNTASTATREYRVDSGNSDWSSYSDQAAYLERESQGRIRIVSDTTACDRKRLLHAVHTVCVEALPPTDTRMNEGSVRRSGLRWTMELPSADFFGHEFGHVLGLADLYDPAQPLPQRRSGSLMAWVDSRPHPLSLYSLRQLGWSLVRDNNRSVAHFALFLGDQYRWCRQNECYTVGFHHRPTEGTQPEPWTLEGEWTQHDGQTMHLEALTRLQQRYLRYEAERGLWQIPQSVLTEGDAGWAEWFYVPDPVPRILVTKRMTEGPWPSSDTESGPGKPDDPLAPLEVIDAQPPAPTTSAWLRWQLPLRVAAGSLLFVVLWRLYRRWRRS